MVRARAVNNYGAAIIRSRSQENAVLPQRCAPRPRVRPPRERWGCPCSLRTTAGNDGTANPGAHALEQRALLVWSRFNWDGQCRPRPPYPQPHRRRTAAAAGPACAPPSERAQRCARNARFLPPALPRSQGRARVFSQPGGGATLCSAPEARDVFAFYFSVVVSPPLPSLLELLLQAVQAWPVPPPIRCPPSRQR